MAGAMIIRQARENDAEAVGRIWNEVIRSSVFTFNSVEKSVDEIRELIAEKRRHDHPVLVAEACMVLGFATYGQFRQGIGYARTMEHTIHLAHDARGRGTGRCLMERLEDEARLRRVNSLIAGISGENSGAIQFHAALGYARVASLPRVGRKFGRWFDLVLMQKFLDP